MVFEYSDSQKRAIRHRDGPLLVLAGPGSGKTAVMAERVRCLITHYHISPRQILAISFTKASAMSLRERISRLTNGRYPQITVCTFHSLFYQILQYTYGSRLPRIAGGRQLQNIAEKILRTETTAPVSYGAVQDFLNMVSRIKAGSYDERREEQLYGNPLPEVLFSQYAMELLRQNLMDMDDILLKAKTLLGSQRETLAFWQSRFPYILVDEFQDISPLQFEGIRLLAGEKQNLFAVGDDDQAIYRFRGARPELMLAFSKYFPQAGQVLLETNYRCPRQIVKIAGSLIRHNQIRYEKKIRSGSEAEGELSVRGFPSAREEAVYVAEAAMAYIRAGNPPEEFAVLFRNHRQSGILTEQLILNKVPFVMKEKAREICDHWIVEDLLAYVGVAREDGGEKAKAQLIRIANKPGRFLSRGVLEQLPEKADLKCLEKAVSAYPQCLWRIQEWMGQNALLRVLPPYGAVRYIRTVMGYDRYLEEYAQKNRLELSALTEIETEFEELVRSMDSWECFCDFQKEKKRQESRQENTKPGIRLSTIHGAKGLEFDTVCIIGVNEGITPYAKAGVVEDLEEERRLFYVAVTRAKKKLQLSFIKNTEKKLQPSGFLIEALQDMPDLSDLLNH